MLAAAAAAIASLAGGATAIANSVNQKKAADKAIVRRSVRVRRSVPVCPFLIYFYDRIIFTNNNKRRGSRTHQPDRLYRRPPP